MHLRIGLLMLIVALILVPSHVHAQVGETAMITDTQSISGTVQIVADSPQAIRALLEEPAIIPGGFQNLILALFWTVLFGGLGGVVFELLRLRGNLALPYRYAEGEMQAHDIFKDDGYVTPKRVVDLGFLARVFVGSMAAIAILLVISPATPMKLFATAVIAGSAGASIFDTLRARLQATLAVADATDVRMKGQKLQQQLAGMEELINTLLMQSRSDGPASISNMLGGDEDNHEVFTGEEGDDPIPLETPEGSISTSAPVDRTLLDDLSRLLGEAKGTSESMNRMSVRPQGEDSQVE